MRTRLFAMAALFLAFAAAILGPLAFSSGGEPAAAVEPTAGDLVYRSGAYSLRLTELPCNFDDLREALEAEGGAPGSAMRALVTEGNRRYSACWMRGVGGEVILQEPNGRGGMIPLDWFKRAPGT